MFYVYILTCNDGSEYTGCTLNIEKRLIRHANGQIRFTKARLPVTLKFYAFFKDKYKAFDFEKYLKTGSGRAFRKRHLM